MSDNLNITGYGTTLTNNFPNDNCLINKNFVTNYFNNSSINIVGEISFFAGTALPKGWLFCNGTSYKRSDYPDLSNVIGSTYGGDANNFNLPDFTSRVPICSQQLDPINIQYQGNSKYSGGNKSMDSNQLASHAHGLTHKHNYNYNINNLSNGNTYNSLISTSGCNAIRKFVYNATNNYLNTTEKTSGTTGNAGGTVNGTPLEFLPPFCVVNFIIYTGKTS